MDWKVRERSRRPRPPGRSDAWSLRIAAHRLVIGHRFDTVLPSALDLTRLQPAGPCGQSPTFLFLVPGRATLHQYQLLRDLASGDRQPHPSRNRTSGDHDQQPLLIAVGAEAFCRRPRHRGPNNAVALHPFGAQERHPSRRTSSLAARARCSAPGRCLDRAKDLRKSSAASGHHPAGNCASPGVPQPKDRSRPALRSRKAGRFSSGRFACRRCQASDGITLMR